MNRHIPDLGKGEDVESATEERSSEGQREFRW